MHRGHPDYSGYDTDTLRQIFKRKNKILFDKKTKALKAGENTKKSKENNSTMNLRKNQEKNLKIIVKKKISIKKDEVKSKQKTVRSFEGKGMTSVQASSIKGVSNLGIKKPAWQ